VQASQRCTRDDFKAPHKVVLGAGEEGDQAGVEKGAQGKDAV
jgi:hypothetical protein